VTVEATLQRPHVFLPADASSAASPLLLLHGTGGSEHDLVPLRQHLSPGAATLAVRGTVMENGMTRFFRRIREGVFDEDDLRRQADLLASFVAAAGEAYQLPGDPMIAVGYSNGANIASALLMLHPELLAGAVLFSAMTPFRQPPDADLAGRLVVLSNGANDPTIPAGVEERLAGQLRDRGAEVIRFPHPGGHQLAAQVLPAISQTIVRPQRPVRPTSAS
jgi:phospholipase/carboxylesterase